MWIRGWNWGWMWNCAIFWLGSSKKTLPTVCESQAWSDLRAGTGTSGRHCPRCSPTDVLHPATLHATLQPHLSEQSRAYGVVLPLVMHCPGWDVTWLWRYMSPSSWDPTGLSVSGRRPVSPRGAETGTWLPEQCCCVWVWALYALWYQQEAEKIGRGVCEIFETGNLLLYLPWNNWGALTSMCHRMKFVWVIQWGEKVGLNLCCNLFKKYSRM